MIVCLHVLYNSIILYLRTVHTIGHEDEVDVNVVIAENAKHNTSQNQNNNQNNNTSNVNSWGHGGIMRDQGQRFIMGAGMLNTTGDNGNGGPENNIDVDLDIIKTINNALPQGHHTGSDSHSPAGKARDGDGRYLPVGSFIDEKIRQIQQGKVNTSQNFSNNGKFDSGKAQELAKTVYNNKVVDVDKHHARSKHTASASNHSSQNVAHVQLRQQDPILAQIFAEDPPHHAGHGHSSSNKTKHTNSSTALNAQPNSSAHQKPKMKRPSSANQTKRDKRNSSSVKDFNQFNPALLF